MSTPREFWIDHGPKDPYTAYSSKTLPRLPLYEFVHVIEFSAYEALDKELTQTRLKVGLATEKVEIGVSALKTEIARLEAEIANNYAGLRGQNENLHNQSELMKERNALKAECEAHVKQFVEISDELLELRAQYERLAEALFWVKTHIKSMDNHSLIIGAIHYIDETLIEYEKTKTSK